MKSPIKTWLQDKESRQLVFRLAITFFVTAFIVAGALIYDAAENRRIDAEAITLKSNLTTDFASGVRVSDFLDNLNGRLVDDYRIDTTHPGTIDVDFEYINIRNKLRTGHFTIIVIDSEAPRIYGGNIYTLPVGYEGDLTNLMLSGDNADDHPTRQIIGDYDLTTPGAYELEYVIADASSNESRQPFTLHVVSPSNEYTPPVTTPKLPLTDVIKAHKTDQTQIGIDVSSWQENIDWAKVKSAGVEFAFIRIGYQYGYDGEYILDSYFEQNIREATAVGLPVGVYFYSYATNREEATAQAEWVIEQLGNYHPELGVAFDWEDWSNFNQTGMSFYTINQVAKSFLDTIANYHLKGLLYGSKVYLERIWQPEALPDYPVWLAQYYDYATYGGQYQIWQMSSSGRVNGINGDVDIDILYKE